MLLRESAKDITIRHDVCQDFRAHRFSDPGVDESTTIAIQLTRLLYETKEQDPNVDYQNALPWIILYFNYSNSLKELAVKIATWDY